MIRFASPADAEQLLAIYSPYVTETAITFEYDVPSLEEFKERIAKIQTFYPYLVYEEDGKILAYAYASSFHPRAAYAWSCEVSIYVAMDTRSKGLGPKLYQVLEGYLSAQGILNCNACIATAPQETPYLSNASQAFHEKLGYRLVGKFHGSGYKFDQWFDMIWMEKCLGEHKQGLEPPRPIHEVVNNGKVY